MRGDEALGGFSPKEGAWPSEAEWDGATTSSPLFLLKTRPVQVPSSSEAVASTTPFYLWLIRVGSGEIGAEVAAEGWPAGVEAPASARAALRRATNSANLFLFSSLTTIYAQEDNKA